MKPTLLVLAAGMGNRYGGLKQIDPVGPHGEAVLDYSVFDARRAGFGKVVFVIRHDIENEFRETVGSRFEDRMEVAYAFQELDGLPAGFQAPPQRDKPWGTGHALLCAREQIDTPFAVINADDFYGGDGYRVLAGELARRTTPDRCCMVGFRLGRTLSDHGTVARGVCTADADGFLRDVEELTGVAKTTNGARQDDGRGHVRDLTGDELVSMNMWGFHPSLFEKLEREFVSFLREKMNQPKAEFFIPTVVNALIKGGEVKARVLQTDSPWFGVTYREDKPVVVASIQRLVDAGVYPAPLWPPR